MWKNPNKPSFGNLDGVKVLWAGGSTSAPYAAQLLADSGADVTWLENPKNPEPFRFIALRVKYSERRNQRNICLDISTDEGKEVFRCLISEADIFLESSKGGTYKKLGFPDEELFDINPGLVIVHVSGYGQTGLPEYVTRASYDGVAQAFAGLIDVNQNFVTPPYPIGPYSADYTTAMYAAFGAVTALYRAKITGVGESVDVAQYEATLRNQAMPGDWFTDRVESVKAGGPQNNAGQACYLCKDGKYVMCNFFGGGVFRKLLPLLGFEYGSDLFPEGLAVIRYDKEPEAAKALDDALKEFCIDRTAKEVEEFFIPKGLPVNKVNDYTDIENDPQVAAREMIIEYETYDGQTVKSQGFCPKFVRNPGIQWSAGCAMGGQNDEILAELGFSTDDIRTFYAAKAVVKR
jgi:L-carnitine CoA-transferase